MPVVCKRNKWITKGLFIGIQVAFVFTFLTFFFFLYVSEVEKEEFQSQINIVIDDIMKDIQPELTRMFKTQKSITPEDAVVVSSGVIDLLQEKIAIDSKTTVRDIFAKNRATKMIALKTLSTFLIIIISLAIIIIFLGFCTPILDHVKEGMIVVVFIGITELLFLQIIAKNYITADPNVVRASLGKAISSWIQKNNKI